MYGLLSIVGNIVFSSFEYFSILYMIFSVYNLHPQYFKKEIAIIALSSTTLSLIFILLGIVKYVPVPVLVIPVVTFIIAKHVPYKTMYVAFVTAAGFIIYSFIQFGMATLTVYYKFITASQVTDPFTYKSFIIQTICACIALIISVYVRTFNGGFGFSFSGERGHLRIFHIIIGLLFLTILNCVCFFINETLAYIKFSTVLMFVFIVLVLYMSKKRDDVEFTE